MLAACTGGGGAPIAAPTPTPLPATFNTSGSTNTTPFTFVIHFDGSVNITGWEPTGGQISAVAPLGFTNKLYSDILANLPVSNIPTSSSVLQPGSSPGSCAKPASFATTVLLTYDGLTSGDISCPASPAATQLYLDYAALENQVELILLANHIRAVGDNARR